MSRAYTIEELDALREACAREVPFHVTYSCGPGGGMMEPNKDDLARRHAAIEDRARTYMLAGLTAEDLDRTP